MIPSPLGGTLGRIRPPSFSIQERTLVLFHQPGMGSFSSSSISFMLRGTFTTRTRKAERDLLFHRRGIPAGLSGQFFHPVKGGSAYSLTHDLYINEALKKDTCTR